jgi:hypothetical protein
MHSINAIPPEPEHECPENQNPVVQDKAVKKKLFPLINRHAALRITERPDSNAIS